MTTARHRGQFRFYDEDVEHLEKARRPGESDTAVIRRALRVLASMDSEEPKHEIVSTSEELDQVHTRLNELADQVSTVLDWANRAHTRLTQVEKVLKTFPRFVRR